MPLAGSYASTSDWSPMDYLHSVVWKRGKERMNIAISKGIQSHDSLPEVDGIHQVLFRRIGVPIDSGSATRENARRKL